MSLQKTEQTQMTSDKDITKLNRTTLYVAYYIRMC